jgi:rhodanese-related sulfurtransferase/rubrerythrin
MDSKVISVTSDELKKFMDTHEEKDYIVVDVRQPAEYIQGHIPGAKLIPLPVLGQKLSELPPDRDIVFYCRSGNRSMAGATFVADSDVSKGKIFNLSGGIMAYNGQTLPDFPKLQIFGNVKTYAELLVQAMELEKGAWRFYNYIRDRFPSEPFAHTFEQIAAQETGHAKIIHNHLEKEKKDIQTFEIFFDQLKGNIMESGEDFSDMLSRIDVIEGTPCLNVIELSLSIEYATYDLHRTIAEQIDNADIKEVFFTLAQAERIHMQTISGALDKCPDVG